MDKERFLQAHRWVRDELKGSADFWLRHGLDREHGGVYTCLDRKGEIFSTDKSVWMQGRCGWIYAFLCSNYGVRPEWLEASKSCVEFLEDHCVNHEAGDRLYFTVTGDGRPLRQRRYCFSEDFYTMANAELYANTGDKKYIERARRTYELTYALRHGLIADPTGLGPKTIPETRRGRAFGDPMIYLNVTAVMRRCDPENAALYDERAKQCVDEIVRYHYKPELKCVLETVGPDGELQTDTTAGRVVNPGHDIEGSWLLWDAAETMAGERKDEWKDMCLDLVRSPTERAWSDHGLHYEIVNGEVNTIRAWWPQAEAMLGFEFAWRVTKDPEWLRRLRTQWDYVLRVIVDPREEGEWFNEIREDGTSVGKEIAGEWKCPYHNGRMCLRLIASALPDNL
jgi:N-acylglucosamine 2-epimerase